MGKGSDLVPVVHESQVVLQACMTVGRDSAGRFDVLGYRNAPHSRLLQDSRTSCCHAADSAIPDISSSVVTLRPTFLPFLSTAKDQKALNIGSAKPTSAQQFPATVNRELGHDHDADILGADASFT